MDGKVYSYPRIVFGLTMVKKKTILITIWSKNILYCQKIRGEERNNGFF